MECTSSNLRLMHRLLNATETDQWVVSFNTKNAVSFSSVCTTNTDTERISYAIQPGHAVLTDDPKWKSWHYNKSKLGFALLFIGVLLQGAYLFAVSECR
jgi:hypothetical protein